MIVKLQGGLGNQMFIYAYGASRGAKFDRSGIVPPRTYALDPFHLPIEFEDNAPDARVGYWQSEKCFDHDIARVRFLPIRKKVLKKAVAVHIRLTDNLSERALAFHGNLLETDYYVNAMAYMEHQLGDHLMFFVYSDDIEFCKKRVRFGHYKHVFVSASPCPHQDIWDMASCEYHIIANSSFSWWGAWLGPQKLVIAPKRWFVVDVPGAEDIVPERWIRL